MSDLFAPLIQPRDIHVAASQYLVRYVLIEAVRLFHRQFPQTRIQLSIHSEQEIESVLLRDTDVTLGIAAPYEPSTELEYQHMFGMSWSLILPPRHRLLQKQRIRLRDLVSEPLILFERGSTVASTCSTPFTSRDSRRRSRWRPPRPRSSCGWSRPRWASPSFRYCPAAWSRAAAKFESANWPTRFGRSTRGCCLGAENH